jgi:hypothetical protein
MMATKENPAACNSVPGQKFTDPTIVVHREVDSKRFANLAARAALAGHQLHQTTSGFMLSRWTHSRHCDDLDTAEVLLHRMGG